MALKPLFTFGIETKIKVHRLTNNLQGLQKVMVKDLSWNIIPWNALLFEKTLKQHWFSYRFILNTCHDTAKCSELRVGFPVIFCRLRWPVEPKFVQVCYFIYKLWYTKCGPWAILFTKSVQWLSRNPDCVANPLATLKHLPRPHLCYMKHLTGIFNVTYVLPILSQSSRCMGHAHLADPKVPLYQCFRCSVFRQL